jgi:hypothetical protein
MSARRRPFSKSNSRGMCAHAAVAAQRGSERNRGDQDAHEACGAMRTGGSSGAPWSRHHGDERDGGRNWHAERRVREAAAELCGLVVTGTKGMADTTEATKMPTRHTERHAGGIGGAPRSQRHRDEWDAGREEDAGAKRGDQGHIRPNRVSLLSRLHLLISEFEPKSCI